MKNKYTATRIRFISTRLKLSPHQHLSIHGASRNPLPEIMPRLTYTVKSGDNLGFISEWYNVRVSDIRYWNNIYRNTIRAGQRLAIYVPRNKLAKYQDINRLYFC